MAYFEELPVGQIQVNNITAMASGVPRVVAGDQTTRAAVLAEVESGWPKGSLYLSTAGKVYLKVAVAGASTDWQKVTTSAAD